MVGPVKSGGDRPWRPLGEPARVTWRPPPPTLWSDDRAATERRQTRRSSASIAQDLVCRAYSFFRSALHIALKVYRTVLAGKMTVALTHAFVARKPRVLADFPA